MIILNFFRLIYKIISKICQAIADVLIYFGLVVPLIYVIYATLVCVIYNVNLSVANFHSILYYIGLVLSLICSIIITFRKFHSQPKGIIEPFVEADPPRRDKKNDARRYVADSAEDREYAREKEYEQRRRTQQPIARPNIPYNYYEIGGQNGETPLVYQHSRYPGIICFEYIDRIEYFGINGNQLIYLRCTQKDN